LHCSSWMQCSFQIFYVDLIYNVAQVLHFLIDFLLNSFYLLLKVEYWSLQVFYLLINFKISLSWYFLTYFYLLVGLGFELRASCLSHTSSPFWSACFGDGLFGTICLDCPQTAILPVSASQIARITGVIHQNWAEVSNTLMQWFLKLSNVTVWFMYYRLCC
jgi:hypothetical protein